jgi:hypothetical protein
MAANASREAEGKMLIESALKMELGGALIIRRGIDHVDRDAERGGGLDPGLEAEVGITPLEPTPPGPGLAVGRVCVPVKSAGQQAVPMLHRTRALPIRQQTMLANAFRAYLAEFGIVVAQGIKHVCELIERVFAEDIY